MIPFDWANMTQAVWRSPKLRLLEDDMLELKDGVGWEFKQSLTAYLQAYGYKTKKLLEQIKLFDFRDVRAVFVGHVPGDHPINGPDKSLFGWGKMKRVLLRAVRGGGHGIKKDGMAAHAVKGEGEMVMQVMVHISWWFVMTV